MPDQNFCLLNSYHLFQFGRSCNQTFPLFPVIHCHHSWGLCEPKFSEPQLEDKCFLPIHHWQVQCPCPLLAPWETMRNKEGSMGQWKHVGDMPWVLKDYKANVGELKSSLPFPESTICMSRFVCCFKTTRLDQGQNCIFHGSGCQNPPSRHHQGQGLLHFQYGASLLYPLQGKNVEPSQGRRGGRRKA